MTGGSGTRRSESGSAGADRPTPASTDSPPRSRPAAAPTASSSGGFGDDGAAGTEAAARIESVTAGPAQAAPALPGARAPPPGARGGGGARAAQRRRHAAAGPRRGGPSRPARGPGQAHGAGGGPVVQPGDSRKVERGLGGEN